MARTFGKNSAKQRTALRKNKALWDRMKKVGTVAASDATFETAVKIMDRSRQMVPVRTGWLQSSSFVGKPRVVEGKVRIDLGYTARYALAVHETHRSQSRYLDRAIEEVAPEWPFRVQQGTERRMAKVRAVTIKL
jgi:hypothetical protein